jgi:hypothetical protein
VAVVVVAAATVVGNTSVATGADGLLAHPRPSRRHSKMKFTTVGPEGARNLLREKQRRNRMAAKELRVQFPDLASIRIDFAFSDESTQPPAPQSIVLHPPARAYFVYPCPYASCNGEFDLAAPVTDVAEQGQAGAAGHTRCKGERVRGRLGKTPCDLHVEYSIALDR